MKVDYELFRIKCKFKSLKNNLRRSLFKNNYGVVYVLLIPSIHKHKGGVWDECTVLHTHHQRNRIHKICEEKDCYIMEKVERPLKTEMYLYEQEEWLNYYDTIDRLEQIEVRNKNN